MRVTSKLVLLFLFASGVALADEAPSADGPKASGIIYAIIEVADDQGAEFVEGPVTELPENIVAQVRPALMAKARNTHRESPSEDGLYRLAIDWKIVNVNGQDQMKFEYRNSKPVPVRATEPTYPRTSITAPVEISYHLAVDAEGAVTAISRNPGNEGNNDFYRAGRDVLRRWTFAPQYEDGIAVAAETDFELTFEMPCDDSLEVPEAHGL